MLRRDAGISKLLLRAMAASLAAAAAGARALPSMPAPLRARWYLVKGMRISKTYVTMQATRVLAEKRK